MKKVLYILSVFLFSFIHSFGQTNSYTRADSIHLTNTTKTSVILIDGKLRVLRATAGTGTDSVYSKGSDGYVHLIKVATGSFLPLTFHSNQTVRIGSHTFLTATDTVGGQFFFIQQQAGSITIESSTGRWSSGFGINGFQSSLAIKQFPSNKTLGWVVDTTGTTYSDKINKKLPKADSAYSQQTDNDFSLWGNVKHYADSVGGGGGAAWGAITGTLSDQTDLQSTLDAKQATLVSGTTIKSINSASILASGNLNLQTPLTAGTDYLAPTGSAAGLTGLTSTQVTTALGFTPVTNARTVNGKALSSNITLGLASSDFANQGTATTVLHGNASGNPSFTQIAIADLSATGTPSSTTYLRGDNTWATVSGGGLATTNFVFNETPSGTINGSNVTFTLANTPTSGKVTLYENGVLLAPTTDYTISGSTITFITAPNTVPYTDTLTANYLK